MELGVSYVTAHLPRHIEQDMRDLAGIGCTQVLVTLQENHFSTLTGALDYGAALAKEQGLEPHAVIWGFANTFGGGRMSNLLLQRTDMWIRDPDGTPQPKVCLNHPDVADEFAKLAERCWEAGYTGIFVDEPTRQACYCQHCQDAFTQSQGGDLLSVSGTPAEYAFRAQTVHSYTERLCARCKATLPEMTTVTCVMPVDRDTWDQVATIPELDILGTDPYWLVSQGRMSIEDAVSDARLMADICQRANKESQIWLNCWRIPAGREPEIYSGGKLLAEAGCDALYTWSFRGGMGTNEACDDPLTAWAAVERLYGEISGKG